MEIAQLPVDFPRGVTFTRGRRMPTVAGTDISLKAAFENLPTTSFATPLTTHIGYIRLFHNSIFYVAKLLDIELFTVMKNYSGTKE